MIGRVGTRMDPDGFGWIRILIRMESLSSGSSELGYFRMVSDEHQSFRCHLRWFRNALVPIIHLNNQVLGGQTLECFPQSVVGNSMPLG